MALAALVLQFWVGPALIRMGLRQGLGPLWQGQVSLDEAELSFTGPLELRGLELTDRQGRTWLETGTIRLTLDDWPSLSPVLRHVEVDWVRLAGHFPRGRLQLPITQPEPSKTDDKGTGTQYVDLRTARIGRLIVVADLGDTTSELPSLAVAMDRDSRDRYRLDIRPVEGEDANDPRLEATIGTDAGQFHLVWQRDVAAPLAGLVLGQFGLGDVRASGLFDANVRLDVPFARPLDSTGTGHVRLADIRADLPDQPIVQDLGLVAKLERRSVQVSELRGRTPGGMIAGSAQARMPLDGSLSWDAELIATQVPLAMVRQFAPNVPVRDGRGRARLVFRDGRIDHVAVAGDLAASAELADLPIDRAAGSGRFKLELTGRLDRPAALQAAGTVTVRDLTASAGGKTLAHLAAAHARFDGRTVTLQQAAGQVLGAGLQASGEATLPPAGPAEYRLHAKTLTPLQFGDHQPRVPLPHPLRQMAANLDVHVTGQGLRRISAVGAARLHAQFDGALSAASTRAEFDVTAENPLRFPGDLAVTGYVHVLDASLADANGPLLTAADANVRLDGRRATADAIRLVTPGGAIHGDATARLGPGGRVNYRARLGGDRIDLTMLARRTGFVRSGQATLNVALQGQGAAELTADADARFDIRPDLAELTGARGELAGRLTWNATEARGLDISVDLTDGHADLAEGPAIRDIRASLRYDGRQARATDVSAVSPFGSAAGSGMAKLGSGPITWSAEVRTDELDLAALTRQLWDVEVLGESRLTLRTRLQGRSADRVEIRAVGHASAADAGARVASAGELDANVTLTDLAGEDQPTAAGRVRLQGWRLSAAGSELLTNLGLQVDLQGRQIDLTDLAADTSTGRLTARGRATLAAEGPHRYDGRVELTDTEIAPLLAALKVTDALKSARVHLASDFSGAGLSQISLTGDGGARLVPTEGGQVHALDGNARWDATVTDPLDVEKLSMSGTGRLFDWTVSGAEAPLAERIGLSLLLLQRDIDISSIRGRIGGGQVFGWARLEDIPEGLTDYRGGIRVNKVDLHELSLALAPDSNAQQGRLDAAYGFRGRGLELADLRGRGAITLGSAREARIHPLTAILRFFDLTPASAGRIDATAGFRQEGQLLIVQRANISTPQIGMVIQRGGTVGLVTHEVDVYVIAGLLQDLDNLIETIPVVNLLSGVSGRLSRLHVTGQWDEPATIGVRKQPLEDVGEGVLTFFSGVVKTGGRLGQSVGQRLQDVLP